MPNRGILTSEHLPPLKVGKNKKGLWVVYDPTGMRGGLFTCSASALKFASLSNGRHQDVVLISEHIEFDTGCNAQQHLTLLQDTKPRTGNTLRLAAHLGEIVPESRQSA
jgi:hypothetical protein